MVLKFCNGLSAIWGGGSDAATTAAESKELKMRALELLVTDSHDTRWEKEFRVFFDGTRPIGLGFQPAAAPATLPKRSSMAMAPPSRNNSVKFPTNEYDCIVKEVVPGGLAHDYNDKCRAAGDYSRIITDNLRVRRVNHEDMSGVSFDSVLQKMQAAKPSFFLTFADINSRPTEQPRTKSMVNMNGSANSVVHPRQSTVGINGRRASSAGQPEEGNNSAVVVGRRLSTAQVSQELRQARRRSSLFSATSVNSIPPTTETLVEDLAGKNQDLERQVQLLKEQTETLVQEKIVLQSQNDLITRQKDALAETNKQLQRENISLGERIAAATATPPPPTVVAPVVPVSPSAASRTVSQDAFEPVNKDLETTRLELKDVKMQHDQLLERQQQLQERLAEQRQHLDEKCALADHLQHERDAIALRWKELTLEHDDLRSHVDELHERLVTTQTQQRATEEMLRAMEAAKQEELDRLNALKQEIESTQSRGTELDRLLQHERRRSSVASGPLKSPSSPSEHVALIERLKEERDALEQHRDELLLEISCHEQNLQGVQTNVASLESRNNEFQVQVTTLKEQELQLHERELNLRVEMSQQLKEMRDDAETSWQELEDRIRALQQECDYERQEKERLQAALDDLEGKARQRIASFEKEKEFLQQFKQQLAKGFTVIKYGARGNPHPRVIYCDPQCRWLSWRKTGNAQTFNQPKDGAKAETGDLAEVLLGTKTEVFHRHRPSQPNKCFSLVFLHPCRTLDVEAETVERCQYLVRGFQLLHQEASEKRK